MMRQLFRLSLVVLGLPMRVAAHRSAIAQLADLDDHGLRDIGLTRQDLRDATATPLYADPTRQLVERARERADAALRARRPPPPSPRRALPPAWRVAAE